MLHRLTHTHTHISKHENGGKTDERKRTNKLL